MKKDDLHDWQSYIVVAIRNPDKVEFGAGTDRWKDYKRLYGCRRLITIRDFQELWVREGSRRHSKRFFRLAKRTGAIRIFAPDWHELDGID